MSKRSQIRSATQEGLDRLFGSGNLMIGFPVRPPSSGDTPSTEEPSAEEEQFSNA